MKINSLSLSRPIFNQIKTHLKLCLVTKIPPSDGLFFDYLQKVKMSVLGGVTMVQLRETHGDLNLVEERAIALKRLLAPLNVPLIINDYVQIAKKIKADGVHLGQQDQSVESARKILGASAIIGLSIEDLSQIEQSNHQDISYVTASAIFFSKTKPDCKKQWGIDGLKQVVKMSKHPVTAIGGIRLDNIEDIISTGACGVAVVGAIHDAPLAYEAAMQLRLRLG